MRKFDTKWFLKVKSEAACKELQNYFTILNAIGNKVVMKFDKAERNAQGKNKSNYTYTGRDYKLTIAWEEKNNELILDSSENIKSSTQYQVKMWNRLFGWLRKKL